MTDSQTAPPPELDSLKPHEKEELAAFIELLYWRNGTVPTHVELNQAFDLKLTARQLDAYINSPRIKQYLIEKRSVPIEARARLTAKQLDWIRVACDANDMRPVQIKMKELQVTRTDLNKWQGDQFYQQVMYEQASRSFQNARFGVLRSLAVEAMGGNVTAQKIYLEMTGDYRQQSSVDVKVTHEMRATINLVLDILQKHVDPNVLELVALELETAVVPGLPGAAPIELPNPVVPPRSEIRGLKPSKPKETIVDIVESANDKHW